MPIKLFWLLLRRIFMQCLMVIINCLVNTDFRPRAVANRFEFFMEFSYAADDMLERDKEVVELHDIDATSIQQLIDFAYTGEIIITEENVQVLLPASSLLQIQSVREACCKFLLRQLHPSNVLGIRSFAGNKQAVTITQLTFIQYSQIAFPQFSQILISDEKIILFIANFIIEFENSITDPSAARHEEKTRII